MYAVAKIGRDIGRKNAARLLISAKGIVLFRTRILDLFSMDRIAGNFFSNQGAKGPADHLPAELSVRGIHEIMGHFFHITA